MDKTLFYDVSYGMYVVSTALNGRNVGCVANTFCQITSENSIVSISLNKNNWTNTAIKESKRFVVSIISEDTNPEVIKKFGFFSSKDLDKFEGFDYDKILGLPVLKENTCGYFVCKVKDVVDCGTHDIFLAQVENCERNGNFAPMSYSYYHKVVKGKAPKNAPTYIEENVEKSDSKKHRCLICGYVFSDEKENQKFEELPEDWQCPVCGVSKQNFKELKD